MRQPVGTSCDPSKYGERRAGWFTVTCADRYDTYAVSLTPDGDALTPNGLWSLLSDSGPVGSHWRFSVQD